MSAISGTPHRARPVLGLVLVGVLLAACGDDTDGTPTTVTSPAIGEAPDDGVAPVDGDAPVGADDNEVDDAAEVTEVDGVAEVAEVDGVAEEPEEPEELRTIDWQNLTYDLDCGGTLEVPLTDGSYRPDDSNSFDERLEVTFLSVDPVPTRPDRYIVHLDCLAGGAGGHLSSELFAVMDGRDVDDPVQLLGMSTRARTTSTLNDDGVLVVNDTIHASTDPNCCPSRFRSRQVIWDGDQAVEIEMSRPDLVPGTLDTTGLPTCLSRELSIGWDDADEVELFERALLAAGFTPGGSDGTLDDTTMSAAVRFFEFNVSNPAMRVGPGDPYDSIYTELHQLGNVRRPVLEALGIACDEVELLGG